jgi:hypothetical protein
MTMQRTGVEVIPLLRVEETEERVTAADTFVVDPRGGEFKTVAGGDELRNLGSIRPVRRSAHMSIAGAAHERVEMVGTVIKAEERDRGPFFAAKNPRRNALKGVREGVCGAEELSGAGPGCIQNWEMVRK